METCNSVDTTGAGIVARPIAGDDLHVVGTYHVQCLDADGNVRWEDDIKNLVVNVGKNFMLDNALNTSATAATNVYMGLVNGASAPTIAAADTMASHAGWTELTGVTANRGTPSFSAASAGSKATSSAVAFAITGTATVAGCFIVLGSTAVTTNGSTAGTLFSAGTFTGGNRSVVNGDTLNVSYTLTV